MMMYARVEQGVVREIVETDQRIEDLYHPDLLWIDIASMPGVHAGWIVTDDGFSPPVPEMVLVPKPIADVAELAKRLGELQEQLRMLTLDVPGPLTGRG